MNPRTWKFFFLLGLPFTLLFLLHPNLVIESVLVRVLGAYSLVGIWIGYTRAQPQPRWGWRLFALGATINVTGDFFYTEMYYVQNLVLDPTVGVLIYFVGLVCSLLGLALIIFPFRRQITRDSLIQGSIIAIGFFSLIWLVQVEPSLHLVQDLFEWVKDAAIPIGLVMAIAFCCIFTATPTGRTPSFRLTFLACLLFILGAFLQALGTSDWPTPFAHKPPSDLIYLSDLSFALAYMMLASAFLHPSIRSFHNPPAHNGHLTRDDLILLGVAFCLTPAAFLIESAQNQFPNARFVIVSSCVIFFLVMLRLHSLMRTLELQNQQLDSQKQNLHHMAFHDMLTGLPNRTFLDNYLEHALQRARGDQLGAVLMMDVNRFKMINDTFGHHAGDGVLCQVAQQLAELKRHNDVVGRWGGDEFVFILEGMQSAHDAVAFAQRLSAQVHVEYSDDGAVCAVSLSIGICVFPSQGRDAQTILRYADQAMYRAKASADSAVALYADHHCSSNSGVD
jgi:diguanylate cyclase (GGDEF)-like protein